jgi:hypothetical protein
VSRSQKWPGNMAISGAFGRRVIRSSINLSDVERSQFPRGRNLRRLIYHGGCPFRKAGELPVASCDALRTDQLRNLYR